MEKPRKNRDRILVVDDDPGITTLLSIALNAEGFQCESCNSGEAALVLLKKNGDKSFALVLADILMPTMGGLELLEEIQKSYPEIGVLMISADKNMTDAIDAMRKGALDF